MFGLQKKAEDQTTTATAASYLPAVDIAETDAGYTIHADMPGANKENVSVSFENGVITLSSTQEATKEDRNGKAIHREFRRASYTRAFRVGEEIDADAINAEVANGVLTVHLPRKASAAKKTIAVSAK